MNSTALKKLSELAQQAHSATATGMPSGKRTLATSIPEGMIVELFKPKGIIMCLNGSDKQMYAALFMLDEQDKIEWVHEREACVCSAIGNSIPDTLTKFVSPDDQKREFTGSLAGAYAMKRHAENVFKSHIVPYLKHHGVTHTVHKGSPGPRISAIVNAVQQERDGHTIWRGPIEL